MNKIFVLQQSEEFFKISLKAITKKNNEINITKDKYKYKEKVLNITFK